MLPRLIHFTGVMHAAVEARLFRVAHQVLEPRPVTLAEIACGAELGLLHPRHFPQRGETFDQPAVPFSGQTRAK